MKTRRITRVTTTHDPRGGGEPRLIFALGGSTHLVAEDAPRQFILNPGVTSIGSHASADLCLDGIDLHHAEIRRDAEDEYNFIHLSRYLPSSVDGRPKGGATLRTGCRIELGGWTLSFYREEFADHGRPHGGRVGGTNGIQLPQTRPASRGTSLAGGRDCSGSDPGEYFA